MMIYEEKTRIYGGRVGKTGKKQKSPDKSTTDYDMFDFKCSIKTL